MVDTYIVEKSVSYRIDGKADETSVWIIVSTINDLLKQINVNKDIELEITFDDNDDHFYLIATWKQKEE